MAHVFDTGLSRALRRLLRKAIADHIRAELGKGAPGMYLRDVFELPATIDGGSEKEDMFRAITGGNYPCAAVALGAERFDPSGDEREWIGRMDVVVYYATNHQGTPLDRQRGDVPSLTDNTRDPGVDVAIEHLWSRLAGLRVKFPAPDDNKLTRVSELYAIAADPEVVWLPDLQVAELTFEARTTLFANHRRSITAVATEILADHDLDGAGTANPVVQTLTTLDPP